MKPIHDPVRRRSLHGVSRRDVRWAERIEAVLASDGGTRVVLFERMALTPAERLEVGGRGQRLLQIEVDTPSPAGTREAQELVLGMRFVRDDGAEGEAASRSSATGSVGTYCRSQKVAGVTASVDVTDPRAELRP